MSILVEELAKINLFNNLDNDALSLMVGLFLKKEFKIGDLVIRAGSDCQDIYFLIHGRIQIELVASPNNPPKDIYDLRPGDCLGEFSLVKESRKSANARTKTDCLIYAVGNTIFRDFLEKNPFIGLTCYKNLALILVDRLQQANSLAINFMR